MKHKDEVQFYRAYGVEYTHEEFQGASKFEYTAYYKPKKQTVTQCLYGLSLVQGMTLIDYWNLIRPDLWKYETVLPPVATTKKITPTMVLIEKVIRETLVIQNPQSVYHTVERIINIIENKGISVTTKNTDPL